MKTHSWMRMLLETDFLKILLVLVWVFNILGISSVICHLSLLSFFCCVGESENTPPPVGLAANTLLPEPVASTVAADPSNGI